MEGVRVEGRPPAVETVVSVPRWMCSYWYVTGRKGAVQEREGVVGGLWCCSRNLVKILDMYSTLLPPLSPPLPSPPLLSPPHLLQNTGIVVMIMLIASCICCIGYVGLCCGDLPLVARVIGAVCLLIAAVAAVLFAGQGFWWAWNSSALLYRCTSKYSTMMIFCSSSSSSSSSSSLFLPPPPT